MTDMTQNELTAIVNAAKARQADITPAPWVYDKYRRGIFYEFTVPVVNAEIADNVDGYSLWFSNRATQELITAAPTLNAAVIALDAELTRVKAAWDVEATANLDLVKRIEALEAELRGRDLDAEQLPSIRINDEISPLY